MQSNTHARPLQWGAINALSRMHAASASVLPIFARESSTFAAAELSAQLRVAPRVHHRAHRPVCMLPTTFSASVQRAVAGRWLVDRHSELQPARPENVGGPAARPARGDVWPGTLAGLLEGGRSI